MSDLDSWFRELIQPLRTSARGAHPSRAVLYAYLKGQLSDTWRVPTHSLELHDWTLTEVSQHTLTCRDCAQQLALLRRRELERARPWRDLWYRFPSAIRAHVTVYAFALLALFALNIFLVTVPPAPTVWRTCVPSADIAGSEQDPQTLNRNLKLEGLSRPVKLPTSLSGVCLPVPTSRPLWQTWWIGWVSLIWTMLLGLHILWDLLVSATPQRPAPASAALRSVGFVSVFV